MWLRLGKPKAARADTRLSGRRLSSSSAAGLSTPGRHADINCCPGVAAQHNRRPLSHLQRLDRSSVYAKKQGELNGNIYTAEVNDNGNARANFYKGMSAAPHTKMPHGRARRLL
jgi:hypothetical protein